MAGSVQKVTLKVERCGISFPYFPLISESEECEMK
jgi:hypothetical protein